MSTMQILLSFAGLCLTSFLGWWGILSYFNRQNQERWEGTEKHIMSAIRDLKADIAKIQEASNEDRERVHKVELGFAGLKAEIAGAYVTHQHLNRLREDMARDIAQIRTFCARKHGESSN